MTATSYALTLGAILSVIYTFYTGTLWLIVDLAYSGNVYALTFVAGFFGVICVGLYNWAKTGGRKFIR